jgi:hypothetical protein
MTEEKFEALILADPDEVHEPEDWSKAITGIPAPMDTSKAES